jgi:hypothetical protein
LSAREKVNGFRWLSRTARQPWEGAREIKTPFSRKKLACQLHLWTFWSGRIAAFISLLASFCEFQGLLWTCMSTFFGSEWRVWECALVYCCRRTRASQQKRTMQCGAECMRCDCRVGELPRTDRSSAAALSIAGVLFCAVNPSFAGPDSDSVAAMAARVTTDGMTCSLDALQDGHGARVDSHRA